MKTLPYEFPSATFDNGLASMPWFELMDELGEIACDSRWDHAKDVSFLQNALYAQIGAGVFPKNGMWMVCLEVAQTNNKRWDWERKTGKPSAKKSIGIETFHWIDGASKCRWAIVRIYPMLSPP